MDKKFERERRAGRGRTLAAHLKDEYFHKLVGGADKVFEAAGAGRDPLGGGEQLLVVGRRDVGRLVLAAHKHGQGPHAGRHDVGVGPALAALKRRVRRLAPREAAKHLNVVFSRGLSRDWRRV